MPVEIARAKRYNRLLSLSIFDIDHFKKVNDTFGHSAGDDVLKIIADITRKNRGDELSLQMGLRSHPIQTVLGNIQADKKGYRKLLQS